MRLKLALFILLLTLAACAPALASPAPADSTSQPVAPTSTPPPTAGPTPTLPPPLALLLIPAELDPDLAREYQTVIYDLAQAAGYRFQVLNKFSPDELRLEPNLKIVIAFPPDPGIAGLAAAAPGAQFLVINMPEINAGGNISTLNNAARMEHVAFMAGYIGAMLTEDYHTGVILRAGSPDADVIRKTFRAGQELFCGLCNPYAGPFEDYPLSVEIPADAKPAEYSAYADFLIRKRVDTIFLQPEIATPELQEYLSNVGTLVIGAQSPSKQRSGWAVTLQPDYIAALSVVWPDLLSGSGGKAYAAPIAFTDIDEGFFTPGKQLDAGKILRDLLAGLISTGLQPQP